MMTSPVLTNLPRQRPLYLGVGSRWCRLRVNLYFFTNRWQVGPPVVPPSYFLPTGVECHTQARRNPACVPSPFSRVGVGAAPLGYGPRCQGNMPAGPVLTGLLLHVCPPPSPSAGAPAFGAGGGGGGGHRLDWQGADIPSLVRPAGAYYVPRVPLSVSMSVLVLLLASKLVSFSVPLSVSVSRGAHGRPSLDTLAHACVLQPTPSGGVFWWLARF